MNKENIDITNVVLVTPRLILRPFNDSDLEDFYEYAKVEGVGELAGWPHHKNIEESKAILKRFILERKTFAVVYNGKVVGSVGIERYDEKVLPELNQFCGREVGYVIGKDYWGKGIATEAVKEVIKYLFNRVKLDFVACSYAKDNIRSKKVQEKCDFKYFKSFIYKNRLGESLPSIYNVLFKDK